MDLKEAYRAWKDGSGGTKLFFRQAYEEAMKRLPKRRFFGSASVDREDIAQNALVKFLIQDRGGKVTQSRVSKIFGRLVKQRFISYLRYRGRGKRAAKTCSLEHVDLVNDRDLSVETVLIKKEHEEMIRESLTEADQKVFDLWCEAHSFQKIADESGMSINRVYRAWGRIQEAFKRLGDA